MSQDPASPPDLRPYKEAHRFWSRGDRFGRYEVQAEIGEGSMGRVYRARDPLAGRDVAIKTVRSEYLQLETAEVYRRRFEREAQSAGGLAHPNVVRIFDQGPDFLVMELLEGRLLSAVIREEGPLALKDALPLLTSLASALEHAHARGVIHRDVKPGNVMVQPDGEPRLMDFGLAWRTDEPLAADDRYLGTPAYMAPEQISTGETSARSDVFSFAVLAYELLTGQRPFRGDDIRAITTAVVQQPAAPPSRLAPLPVGCDGAFARALCKTPRDRYAGAADFVRALAACVVDDFIPMHVPLPPAKKPPLPAAPLAHRGPSSAGHDDGTEDIGGIAAALTARRRPRLPVNEPPLHVAIDGCALEVGSDPLNALVLIDGARLGHTPVALTHLSAGPHTLRVIHDGFAPVQVGFTLDEGSPPSSLYFTLYPLPQAIATAPTIGIPDLMSGLAGDLFPPQQN